MAIIFFDGFDYAPSAGSMPIGMPAFHCWSPESQCATGSTTGRYEGSSVLNPSLALQFSNLSTFIVAFALNPHFSGQSNTVSWMRFCDTSVANSAPVTQVGIGINTKLQLMVMTASNTILGTSSRRLRPGRWNWISMKITIHNTTGSVDINVDDDPFYTLSNVNTRSGSTNAYANLMSIEKQTDNSFLFDDFILADTTGSSYNDHITDKKMTGSLPGSNGDTNTWSTTGSSNWDGASFKPSTSQYMWTKYNYSSNVGDVDLYNHTDSYNASATAVYDYVKLTTVCSLMAPGTRTMKQLIKTNGTTYELTSQSVPNGWGCVTDIMTVNPNTGVKFTGTELNAIQTGQKITV